MTDLLKALKRLSVQTGSLACLDCGYEHNCSTHGCAIIREAVEALEKQEKSADEMFRELGYERVEDAENYATFEGAGTRIEIWETGDCSFTEYGKPVFATKEEILACALLIREMEADHEKA